MVVKAGFALLINNKGRRVLGMKDKNENSHCRICSTIQQTLGGKKVTPPHTASSSCLSPAI